MSRSDPLSYLEGGYWVKIEGHTCEASPQVPHAYEFIDAGKLLKDFFAAVDRELTDKGVI